jgi:membrane fusion protein (multidrug efflux system)
MRPAQAHPSLPRGKWPIATTAAIWLCLTQSGCQPRVASGNTPPPPIVTVAEARRMTVPVLASPIGTSRALKEVSLRARVRGFLAEQHFEEGSDVKAGQLLFVIEEEPYRVKVASAQAQLAAAEAALEKAKQSKIREVATAQLALDVAGLALARVEEARQRILLQRRAASQQDFDQAEANRQKGEAQVEADRANLQQAKADYDINILTAEASIAAARSAVREAEIDLGYCRMSTPIAGRVGEAKVKLGNLVGPSAGSQEFTELATVQQLDPMGVDLQASSRYLDRATRLIRDGLPVQVTRPGIEGDEAQVYSGKALFIDNAIDPTTSTVLIKAQVANPDETLLPGEYVKVGVTVDQLRDAVVVPEQAVVETQAGPTVYIIDQGGKVAVAPVKTSITYDGLRVIEAGLEPGREVIVEGLQLVRPGMIVKAERAAPGAGASPGAVPDQAPSTPAAAVSAPTPTAKTSRPDAEGAVPDAERKR